MKAIKRKFLAVDEILRFNVTNNFEIEKKNYPMVSKIMKDALTSGMIKEFDTENKAKRYTKYIPFWA